MAFTLQFQKFYSSVELSIRLILGYFLLNKLTESLKPYLRKSFKGMFRKETMFCNKGAIFMIHILMICGKFKTYKTMRKNKNY